MVLQRCYDKPMPPTKKEALSRTWLAAAAVALSPFLQGCFGAVVGINTAVNPATDWREYAAWAFVPASSFPQERALAEEFGVQFRELGRMIVPVAEAKGKGARVLARKAGVQALGLVSFRYSRGLILVSLRVSDVDSGRLILTSTSRYDSGLDVGLERRKVVTAMVEDIKAKLPRSNYQ